MTQAEQIETLNRIVEILIAKVESFEGLVPSIYRARKKKLAVCRICHDPFERTPGFKKICRSCRATLSCHALYPDRRSA